MIYVNDKLEKFESVDSLILGKSSGRFSLKNFIFHKCNLQIFNGENLIGFVEDIQPLYLFPTTILDYAKALNKTNENLCPVKVFVNDFSTEFFECFKNLNLDYLKCYEFLIDKNSTNFETDILKFLQNNRCYFSLNIKNLNNVSDEFLKQSASFVDYYKIFLPDCLGTDDYDLFLNKLKIVCDNKNNESLINIKTYLNENQAMFYDSTSCDFKSFGVDVFQVSKKLIDENQENKKVGQDVQNLVRNLEKKYNGKEGFKFLSVKNISTLYYPRFELDDRNTRNCYASKMCPYVYKNLILPCKVKKVIEGCNNWKLFDLSTGKGFEKKECGKKCDDCASIFENDTLQKIYDIIKDKNFNDLKFVIGVDCDD